MLISKQKQRPSHVFGMVLTTPMLCSAVLNDQAHSNVNINLVRRRRKRSKIISKSCFNTNLLKKDLS